MEIKFEVVQIDIPENTNVILGQSHFIKTVEDIYETITTYNPTLKFGIAFNEASGPRLIRYDGNDNELIKKAVSNMEKVAAGHVFIIMIKEGFPISIKNQVLNIQEVVNLYAATANPLQVIIGETSQGRGVLGVIDGEPPLGVEDDQNISKRKDFLRKITKYKR